jgi:hypothetical protein
MLAVAISAVTAIARHTAIAAVAADPARTDAAGTVDHKQHPARTGLPARTTDAANATVTGSTAGATGRAGHDRIRAGRPGATDTTDATGATRATLMNECRCWMHGPRCASAEVCAAVLYPLCSANP